MHKFAAINRVALILKGDTPKRAMWGEYAGFYKQPQGEYERRGSV